MKNRTVIGVLCIILSLAIVFGITPLINKISSNKIEVIQLNKKISQGKMITGDDIVKVKVGSYGVKDNAIKDENLIIGKFAKSDLYPDINMFAEMFSDNAATADDVFKSLDGIKQAISITIPNFASSLSGKLKNGDIVSIIVVSEGKSEIPAELTYIRVITTTTSNGEDSDNLTVKDEGTTNQPATVTLLVNQTQAKLLALYDQNAKINISLVYRGNAEIADKFLAAQEKMFESEDKANG